MPVGKDMWTARFQLTAEPKAGLVVHKERRHGDRGPLREWLRKWRLCFSALRPPESVTPQALRPNG